jgi:hypothetical protein
MRVGLLGILVSLFVFVVLVFIVLLVFILVKVKKKKKGEGELVYCKRSFIQSVYYKIVKSVDLDTWVQDQVENMVRWGNERANK